MAQLRKGKYRHYKGKLYEVVGLARHSESLEEMVVYKALYKNEYGVGSLWVRPKGMFMEDVLVNGIKQPRFTYISG